MRADRLASLLLFALTCIPVLLVVPFPTQDGPTHLYTAHVSQILADGLRAPLLHRFFEPSAAASATWAGTWIVQSLSRWCAPPLVPSILVLTGVSGLFLAFCREEAGRTPCFFPRCFLPAVCYGFVVRMGFFSFFLSLPLVVVSVRLWLARTNEDAKGSLALFSGALVMLSLLHPVPTLWVLVVCASATAASFPIARKRLGREVAWLAVCSIPLVLTSVLDRSSRMGHYDWERVTTRIGGIFAGGPFVGLQPWTLVVSSVSAMLLVSLALLALRDQLRDRSPDDPYPLRLLAAVGAALLMALLSPEAGSGGGYIGVRCQLLLFLLLLECTRRWHVSRRTDVFLSAAFLSCSVLSVGSMLGTMQRESAAYREIVASTAVLPYSTTVLTVMAADRPDLADLVRPLLHAGDLLGLSADRVLLANYQADLGYFAIAFRPSTTPFGVLFDRSLFYWGPPQLSWDKLPTFAGGVEHVGVWNEDQLLRTIWNATDYRRIICDHYEEVYRSRDWPWVIYRLTKENLRGSPPAICR
jgi:hypothetical protein